MINITQSKKVKSLLYFIFLFIVCSTHQLKAQITVSGQSSATSIPANTATEVESSLTVTASGDITDFTVSIIDSYSTNDQLSYTGSLPSGITVTPWNTTTRSIVFNGTTSATEWQTFLRTVTITSGSVCSPETRKVSFAAGETYYNPLNGHFYRLTPAQSTWTNSQNTASSTSYYGREGYLVTLTSDAENTFVSRLVGQNSWMGASDDYTQINNALGYAEYTDNDDSEGDFYWVTGPEKGTQITTGNGNGNGVPGVYQNWRNDEPNDWGGDESFGHVYTTIGDWNDFPNSETIYGIMEFGDMPNDATVSAPQFSKDISIQGASSGSISGGDVTVCTGTNSTTLTLNDLIGTVVRWESSTNNFITTGTPIANITTTLTATNISETTYYRAVVNSVTPTVCTGLVTSSTPVNVSNPQPGNVFAENTTICAGADVELYVSGQEGTVQKWQRSSNNSTWTDIANTTTTLTETVASVGTVYYRVQVEISGCGATVTSPSKEITVVSGTAPEGGQVSSTSHGSVTNSGTLTLTGHTGTISKWQQSTDNGIIWSDITNTTTTQNYSNIAETTLFRAQLTNGSCGTTFSDEGSVTILSAPAITSFTPNLAGNSDLVTITGTGFNGVTSVAFGATNALGFTVVSDTEITATVGTGSSGSITVINPAGNDVEAGFIYKVVQYDFENNVLDETDNNHDGTEISTVTYDTGAQGQAICFDDGPGYVKLPDNLIRNLSEFTISLRFKSTGTGAILGYQNIGALSGTPTEWIPILMITSDGKLKGTLWTGAVGGSIQAISANTVNDGNWHQVDFVGDTNAVSIYLDGNLEASESGASVVHLSMIYNQLGLSYTNNYNTPTNTTWEYFDGCLDDMLIIDRALTALEIEEVTALPEPTITSFTPTEVGEQETVVITGANFDGATQVTFGGADALSYTVDSPTQITTVVENGASGDVAVTTAGGTATANGFTFTSKTSITTSVSSLDEIIYCGGDVSAALDFEVSASDVYQDMVISAPAGFEVSLSENSGFASSISVTPVANAIANTTVYLRVATAQNGRFSGNVSLTVESVSESIAISASTNNSLYFDGVDDYVNLSGNSLQDGATDFTIEAWILPDNSNYDGNYHAIFGRQPGNGETRNPSFYIIDGQIHIDAYADSDLTRFDALDDEPRVLQNVWTHIALVKDDLEFTVYINGQVAFTYAAPTAVNISGPYQFGFIDNYFAGKIDDVRFWDDARTATEIANNIDAALTGGETGLVGYYTFNEGVADGTNTGLNILADNSPSAIDGTLLNMNLSGSTSNWVQGYFPQISGNNSVAIGAQTQLTHLESGGMWSSNDTAIATVNQSGLVSGVDLGTIEISYTICGQTTTKSIEVNNPPGFTQSETALTVAEAGGTDTFTVVLDAEPTSDVVFDVSSDDTNEATVSSAQLTYTAANWDTPQTITVTGVNDDIDSDDSATITITVNDAGSDDAFDALADQTVAITLTDDDDAGFTQSETALTIAEDGGTDTFTVVLDSEPTSNVVFDITSNATGEATVSSAQLTFTSANWDIPQTITVTGLNDDIDSDDSATITVAINAAGSDDAFDALADQTVAITLTDDDDAGFTQSETALTITEAGGTDTFTVVLDSEPTSNVVFDITSNATGEATVSAAQLTFTSANWDIPQTITVTGVNDDIDRDDLATITVAINAAGSDDTFDALADQTVAITLTDDDTAGFTQSETALTIAENAGTDSFTIVLNAEPSSAVVFDVASNDANEATVSSAQLTFTSADWDTPQTISVTGIDDSIAADDTAVITISINDTGSADEYDALPDQTLAITLTNDDVAVINISSVEITTTGITIDENGGTGVFSVELGAAPLSDVVIDFSSNDTNEATISPTSLTFTPANWDTSQTVTVTGVDDDIDRDDSTTFTIAINDALSNDVYDSVPDETAPITITDDDSSAYTLSDTALTLDEAAGTDTFTIVLNTEPISAVVFDVSSDDTDEATVSSTQLTFTSTNWDNPQRITVTGVNDDIDRDDSATITVAINAADSDDAFDALANQTVAITLTDDDSDSDTDGIIDPLDNCPATSNSNQLDTNSDGEGDVCDTDDDGDGTPDDEDAFPKNPDEDTDTDGDGTGDNEDDDDDNDGTPDIEDDFPTDPDEDTDSDGDGTGDNIDTDIDGDGVPNTEDLFPNDLSESEDTDGDGLGNNMDLDDDNDGIDDNEDAFPENSQPRLIPAEAFTPNGDGINDGWVIPGIDNYPKSRVIVYNRWGHEVFNAIGYRNDWQGNHGSNSEKLPPGSYLYIINLGNGSAPIQGWLFINY